MFTHSHSSSSAAARDRLRVKIICPKCGQTGSAIWEENGALRTNEMPLLQSLSGGFERRLNKSDADSQIFCGKCNSVVD